jgi:O-antigen/teichoic acid export membrane protein
MFVSALFPYAFTALGRQRGFFLVTGIALIFRLLFELWLIPKFGYMAACVIAAWCEILPFAAYVLMLTWGRIRSEALGAFVKPAFAGLVMGIVLVCIRHYFPGQNGIVVPVGLVLVAGLCYLVVLFGARAFSKAELLMAKEALSFLGPYLRSVRQKPGTLS